MNKVKHTFKWWFRHAKILRYKTYKHWGFWDRRTFVDKAITTGFLVALVLTTLGLFALRPEPSPKTLTDVLIAQTPEGDVIHSDLGDEPVVAEKTNSLIDLEKGVVAGTIDMTRYTLQKGETLSGILGRAQIPASERPKITDAIALLYDLKLLKPETTIAVFKDKQGLFMGLSIPVTGNDIIAVLKEEGNIYTPFSHEGRVETKAFRVAGTIERTFSGSAQKAGLSKSLTSYITNSLDGEIDFSTFKPNDAFDIIYEKKMTAGGLELDTQVVYIGFKMGKKEIHRYSWTDASGTPSFFSPTGESASKALLKRPVKANTRLTSPYGNRRHPVLMYNVFHSGVDLAAPMNTPIMAAGDGVITQLGRKGAYGKYIRIKHSSGYQTAYGHMNGYKSTLKVGSQVKRGEVIGYIGSTGRSTGPHLHFEVIKNGKTTSPFGTHTLVSKQLKGADLENFQTYAASIHPDFQKQLIGTLAPVPPKKPALS